MSEEQTAKELPTQRATLYCKKDGEITIHVSAHWNTEENTNVYICITESLLYSNNQHNILYQLYLNLKNNSIKKNTKRINQILVRAVT